MKKVMLLLFSLVLIQEISGQYQIGIIPRVSPDKKISQTIGYTDIGIEYGSPSVNNRVIWGELVPYGQVWRAGANSATIVNLSTPIQINDAIIDSGSYSLFVIPKENDKWTIILNSISKQWGAFRYDQSKDVIRIEIPPQITNYKTEQLVYAIGQTGFKYGSINLYWDYMRLEIPFKTNYLLAFEEEIEYRASAQPDYIKWIPYIQGAEHLEQIGDNLELATDWINKAEAIMNTTTEWNDQFYPRPYVEGHLYWIKAKLLANKKKYTEATIYVDKLKALNDSPYYSRNNESQEIDILYSSWQKN